jgi:hypothetical protein
MLTEINTLKQELYDLMELQKGILLNNTQGGNNVNDKSRCTVNMTNTNEQVNLSILQNMENFIVVDGKIILVDNDKNLYHLKKCKKYSNFIKEKGFTNKEDAFNAYIEQYQNKEKDLSEGIIDSILESDRGETVRVDEILNVNEKKEFTDFNLSDSN